MAWEKRGLKNIITKIRIVYFPAWVMISTLYYAALSFVSIGINKSFAWSLSARWADRLLREGGVKVQIKGLENIDKNNKYVFISNHVSSLDIPVLFSSLPFRLNFLAKKELFRIPVFGWGLRAMGHISIDRSSPRKARVSILKAVETIKKSERCLVLFPEGTRSENGKLNEFKSASFTLSKKAGIDIVPLYISGAEKIMPKKSWIVHQGVINLRIGKIVPAASFSGSNKKELSERLWNEVKNLEY